MSKKSEKRWDDMNELLAMAGSNLNILEEEVDVKVQKKYFKLVEKFSKAPDDYQLLCEQYIENVYNLFDPTIEGNIKKEMLVILATIDDISIYRSIEIFAKQKGPLQKWAIIALQQSRMLIQSTLLDDPGVFISTGLGGQGSLLRYFCVFLNRDSEPLQDFQQNIIKNETSAAITPFKGVIEQIDFRTDYTSMILLLPLDIDLKTVFENIIDECNLYGNFLHENMIITNVKKLSEKEIKDILKTKE